ncbi:MAG: 2OG-Fe dioxygenase family protein [Coxiellaceae bacterium]|nr:2OG-Fe dioxygenase family protein [Coxiellaceae bacterium]
MRDANSIEQHTLDEFENKGYLIWKKSDYQLTDSDEIASHLKGMYRNKLALDPSAGSRYRAYLKLQWKREDDKVTTAKDQRYFQTSKANNMDGGKPRAFKMLNRSILNDAVFSKVLHKNKQFIRDYTPLSQYNNLVFGVHFIRYLAKPGSVSYSSPVWLHTDDEPLVFVHLIDLSANAIGGDNLAANQNGEIFNAVRLTHFFDTMILNRNIKHAVTPLGTVEQEAHRDIILFTVEPDSTNHLESP